jgi:hypothetical protein
MAAVLLCYHTQLIFGLSSDSVLSGLVFFSTLAVYSLHAYFRPLSMSAGQRIKWIQSHRKFLLYQAFVSAIIAIVLLSFQQKLIAFMCLLAIISLAYSLPRILIKNNRLILWITYFKTFYLTIVWTIVTFFLPLYQQPVIWSLDSIISLLARILLLFQLCVLFEWKDRQESLESGQKVLINILNDRQFVWLKNANYLLMILMASIYYYLGQHAESALSLGIPSAYLWLVVKIRPLYSTDYWYYFIWDGALLMPALVIGITSLVN